MSPIAKAAAGLVITPEGAPIMTPPASEAFRISSMLNLSLVVAEKMKEARHAAVSEIIVLPITIDFSRGVLAK